MKPHLFLEDLVMTTYNVMRPLKTFARMLTFTAGLALLPTLYSACAPAEEKKPTVAGCYFDSDCWNGRVCVSANDQPLSSANPGKCAYGQNDIGGNGMQEDAGQRYDTPPEVDAGNPREDPGIDVPPQPECTDEDRDGFYRQERCGTAVDCDDKSQEINPAVVEVCDDKDNNCDTRTDEDVRTKFYHDADRDSFGNPNDFVESCYSPSFQFIEDNRDCNDGDRKINPDAIERCGNEIDEDCSRSLEECVNRLAVARGHGTIQVIDLSTGEDYQILSIQGNARIYSLYWMPDKERIIFNDLQGRINRVNADGTNFVTLLDVQSYFSSLHPDGETLAFDSSIDGRGLYTTILGSNRITKIYACSDDYDRCLITPSWSPEGDRIVFADSLWYDSHNLFLVNPDGTNVEPFSFDITSLGKVNYSPDGTKLLFSHGGGTIFTLDLDQKVLRRLTESDSYSPVWSLQSTITYSFGEDIWVMNEDGSNKRLLLENGRDPSWSPNGEELAFVRSRLDEPDNEELFVYERDREELYVFNRQENNIRRVTNNWEMDINPQWSPDGRFIAFIADRWQRRVRDDRQFDDTYVGLVNADGTNYRLLTNDNQHLSNIGWSPDSQHILFKRIYDLAVIDLDEEGNIALVRNLLVRSADCVVGSTLSSGSWSPDGGNIVFSHCGGIYTMGAHGGDSIRIMKSPSINTSPQWSPDGRFIAFNSNALEGIGQEQEEDTYGIYVMDIQRTTMARIARGDYASWSPDGTRLAISKYNGLPGIWIVDQDGNNPQQITGDPGDQFNLSWSR